MATLSQLADICVDSYSDASGLAVSGFRRLPATVKLDSINRTGSSFYGALYVAAEVGVVAFRGSAEMKDWYDADVDIALGKMPIDQTGDAFAFFVEARTILQKEGVRSIYVTGHSLGGGLAQLVGATRGPIPTCAVTFNAPGMAGITAPVKLASGNEARVFNYRAKHDPVSLRGRHIGAAPVSVDVTRKDVSLLDAGIVFAGGILGAAQGPAGIAAGVYAANSGIEHKMGPLASAIKRSSLGGVRH